MTNIPKLEKQLDPLAIGPRNTPKQVLVALVDLNEHYHGVFESVMQRMTEVMEDLRIEETYGSGAD